MAPQLLRMGYGHIVTATSGFYLDVYKLDGEHVGRLERPEGESFIGSVLIFMRPEALGYAAGSQKQIFRIQRYDSLPAPP